VITQIQAARRSGYAGDIIINGCSPTILLDNGPHCQSWERKALKNIVEDVLKPFPSNLLQPFIKPAYRETLSYVVQYNESAWQFINRLAADYGEWLYYNGQQLIMGASQGLTFNLIYGMHLSRFTLSVQTQPANFQLLAYDYMHHETYCGTPQPSNAYGSGLEHLAQERSQILFNAEPRQWHNRYLTNKKQLDDHIALQAASRSGSMVQCKGRSDMPGLRPGSIIRVSGRNVYTNTEEFFGDFTITSVQHVCDGHGHYNNDLIAVPASVKVPPVRHANEPRCETQSARVTDNYDYKGLGRVRVRFHWMNDNEKSPWLRIASPYAGEGKGFFAMPEVGEEVMVAFEGDHPSKPYVIGSLYHGKATCDFSTKQNDLKVFQSRSGNKILLNDQSGSVMIEDKDGNSLKLDGAGAVQIISKESLVLCCGDAIIELKKDGTISLKGKDLIIDGKDKVMVNSELITLN